MSLSAHARHALKTALPFAAANEVIAILDFVHDRIVDLNEPQSTEAETAAADVVDTGSIAEKEAAVDPAPDSTPADEPDPADAPLES